MTDLDGERALALAVLERAARDLAGGSVGKGHRRSERRAPAEARAWISDGGEMFRWWCLVAGIEPSRARRFLLAVDGRASGGRLLRRAR